MIHQFFVSVIGILVIGYYLIIGAWLLVIE